MIDTDKTKTKGTTAVTGVKGDIIGIHCKIAQTRKYIFAKRTNWRRRAFGMKVIILYFVVDIVLFLKCKEEIFCSVSFMKNL